MRITDMLKKTFIIEELKATTKCDVLSELASIFPREDLAADFDGVINVLLEREKLGSTGIGEGIAIPHGKVSGLRDLIVSFGRSAKGIDFNAMDGKPVHLLFLLLAPENSAGQHLKALAKISRMLKDQSFRQRLMAAGSQDEIYRAIVEKDREC